MSRPGLLLAALVLTGAASACSATAPPHVSVAASARPSPAPTNARGSGVRRTFASPSGNITCVLSRRSAECAVRSSRWSLTPSEENACGASALQGAQLDAGRPARVLCGTGVLVPAPQTTLAYGHSVTVAGFRCRSTTRGVTCRDAHHSFEVSRTVLRLS